MQTVTSFPHDVRVIENTFITMPDGTRLSARIWLPEDAERNPVPAVLEYIPYRHRDTTRARDDLNHPYIAGHGYASVRVDLRGSGNSDGVLEDEYLPAEQDDACVVIDWLSKQQWCDGNVGMMGISWGGFNSLHVAAKRPPALKAIITASATDDLYVDNMHYMGGCLLSDNLSEATVMFAFNSMAPDPEIVGDRWRDMWLERLRGSGLWVEKWLEHQHRDDYWKRASINENYSDVACPVFAVGGWADGYTNAIFRLMENLDVPRKGLIGPWGHKYPHLGVPGPAIGFLQEVVRWWDHWLKGVDNGVMDEPMLRMWRQDSVPPHPSYPERPGTWIAEPCWPSPQVEDREYTITRFGLDPELGAGEASATRELTVRSPMSVGMAGGKWASYAATPDLPSDQREEDGGALVFETDPLTESLTVVGLPKLDLTVSADKPVAMVAARLSDIAPDGQATRVTYGLLNLTHRDGSADPQPVEPGRRYEVRVKLNGMAHEFPAGHRVRLSISTSYFPLVWPSPEAATVTLVTGDSRLILPTRPGRVAEDAALRPFGEPEAAEPLSVTQVETGEHHWRTTRDLETAVTTLEIKDDQGEFVIDETGTVLRRATTEWFSFQGNEVDSARGETETVRYLGRGDWQTEVRTRTVLTSTPEDFVITAQLDAYEFDRLHGTRRIHSENWNRSIPRRLV
ncbi:CocE/NonD family hydrolase [Rhodococcus sp. SJ-2]